MTYRKATPCASCGRTAYVTPDGPGLCHACRDKQHSAGAGACSVCKEPLETHWRCRICTSLGHATGRAGSICAWCADDQKVQVSR